MPYSKKSETFLRDYKLLIDFMSSHKFNGLIIYGFLRDGHGGIKAAQDLCEYAKRKGIKIIPGVGINSYGGVYWEGDHKYNLTNWLRMHPELEAKLIRPQNYYEKHYLPLACPSKKEMLDWNREAIQWLCENFEIGGINFESGDYGICQCEICQKRAKKRRDEYMSLEDMVDQYGALFDAAWSVKKDLWLICECYFDNIFDSDKFEPLKKLPQNTIFQWTVNRQYWQKVKKYLTKEHVSKLPGKEKILRTHMGSQWNEERYTLVARTFAEMCQIVSQAEMAGCTIFGEVSDFSVVNEINYLAFEEFACNPQAEWDFFVEDKLGEILGGKELATRYLNLLNTPVDVKSLREAIRETKKTLMIVDEEEVYRRWIWLANRLYALLYDQLKTIKLE
jgi:hypothetical protein